MQKNVLIIEPNSLVAETIKNFLTDYYPKDSIFIENNVPDEFHADVLLISAQLLIDHKFIKYVIGEKVVIVAMSAEKQILEEARLLNLADRYLFKEDVYRNEIPEEISEIF
jgi:hypothetical protein